MIICSLLTLLSPPASLICWVPPLDPLFTVKSLFYRELGKLCYLQDSQMETALLCSCLAFPFKGFLCSLYLPSKFLPSSPAYFWQPNAGCSVRSSWSPFIRLVLAQGYPSLYPWKFRYMKGYVSYSWFRSLTFFFPQSQSLVSDILGHLSPSVIFKVLLHHWWRQQPGKPVNPCVFSFQGYWWGLLCGLGG